MKKNFVLFVLIMILNSLATIQKLDELVYDGKKLYVEVNGTKFLNAKDYEKSMNTACWKGYTADWEVLKDSLFIRKMYSCKKDKIFGLDTIWNGINKNGFANGFTGVLEIKGYGSIGRNVSIDVHVKNGIIQNPRQLKILPKFRLFSKKYWIYILTTSLLIGILSHKIIGN